MGNLIDFTKEPLRKYVPALLKDKTTRKNIVFATTAYADQRIDASQQMTATLVIGTNRLNILPRVEKARKEQATRTRNKAEVFTPSWICNKMNNHCDAEWFGKDGTFNKEDGQKWRINGHPVAFPDGKTWQNYVDSRRLEITCGEAPYLVSRYDTTTGELIPVDRRIGILDRKLRVVNENTEAEAEWLKWLTRAYQASYGYEYQGDNLLIARANLLLTFRDYMVARWDREPTDAEYKKLVNVICWNIWQMDGITGTVPFGIPADEAKQISFFDMSVGDDWLEDKKPVECRVYDWRAEHSITYNSMKEN